MEWGRKNGLRVGTGQLWRVMEGEVDSREEKKEKRSKRVSDEERFE